jgi:hypothetical protein
MKRTPYLHDFTHTVLHIWCERRRHIVLQIGDADALSDDMDRILRHNTHLLFPLAYSPALSPLCFPSLTRKDITTPAHPLRIHTRQERTQQQKLRMCKTIEKPWQQQKLFSTEA